MLKRMLQLDGIAFLLLLMLLGWAGVRLNRPLQANAAAKAADKVADGIVEMERLAAEIKPVPQTVACGEFFTTDVAQALCSRIAFVLKRQSNKKGGKETKAEATVMETKELAAKLAQHYELPLVEAVDKVLRKEKKKLRQTVQALQKVADEAQEAESRAFEKSSDLSEAHKVAEDSKRSADAKKGPKNAKKEADVEFAKKLADDAKKSAAAKAADAAKAIQAAELAKMAEDRPSLLVKLEGAWLSAVTEVWCQFATKLGGVPTPSHMHLWARDKSLRQTAEQSYNEVVGEKTFLD